MSAVTRASQGRYGGRHTSRHGERSRRRLPPLRPVIGAALTLGLIGGCGWYLMRDPSPATASGCSEMTDVVIAADPQLAAVLPDIFQITTAPDCTQYRVETVASGAAASAAKTTLTGDAAPDAWIADSPAWVDIARAKGLTSSAGTTIIATSPLVMATVRGAPFVKGDRWADFASSPRLVFTDPRTTTTGRFVLLAPTSAYLDDPEAAREVEAAAVFFGQKKRTASQIRSAIDESEVADAPIYPATEQEVVAANASGEGPPLAAVVPSEGTTQAMYSLVPLTEDGVRLQAVTALRQQLTSAAGRQILRDAGFRAGPGDPPMSSVGAAPALVVSSPSKSQFDFAGQIWDVIDQQLRLLVVLDTSGSMKATDGPGGSSRISAAVVAAKDGMKALTPTSRAGVWAFATGLDGDRDYRQVAPVGSLGAQGSRQRQRIASALDRLPSQAGGDTGLYDTIAAAYRNAVEHYRAGDRSVVVVLTDGRNDDTTGGLRLAELQRELGQVQDAQRPVSLVLVGIGDGASEEELKSIVGALKPAANHRSIAFVESDPAKIRQALYGSQLPRSN